HQDGLVHISAMSHKFVNDPREIVKPGDVVTVKVLDVDVARNRIGLSLRTDDEPGATPDKSAGSTSPGKSKRSRSEGNRQGGAKHGKHGKQGDRQGGADQRGGNRPSGGAMADALRKAGYEGKN